MATIKIINKNRFTVDLIKTSSGSWSIQKTFSKYGVCFDCTDYYNLVKTGLS